MPIEPGAEAPALAGGWFVEPGDLLVAGPDGLSAYNLNTGETRSLSTAPIAAAYYEDNQLVFQGTPPGWAQGDPFGGPSSAAIWRRLGPLGAADLVYDPGPFAKADLHGIFDLGSGPGALIRLHAYQNDDLWVLQPFDGGPWQEIGFLSGGEVDVGCTAWTGSDLLQAAGAEGYTWIALRSLSDDWNHVLPPEDESWEGMSCVAVNGETVFVLFQPWGGGPASLITADLTGSVLDTVTIDSAVEDASSLDVDSSGKVVVTTLGGGIYLVESASGAATMLPVTGARAVFAG